MNATSQNSPKEAPQTPKETLLKKSFKENIKEKEPLPMAKEGAPLSRQIREDVKKDNDEEAPPLQETRAADRLPRPIMERPRRRLLAEREAPASDLVSWQLESQCNYFKERADHYKKALARLAEHPEWTQTEGMTRQELIEQQRYYQREYEQASARSSA